MMPLIGLGTGGHAKVMIEIIRGQSRYDIRGLLDADAGLWGTQVLGCPVIGDDRVMPELFSSGIRHAFVGVGGSGNTHPRRTLYERARQAGFSIVDTIHPKAVISTSAVCGEGVTIMAGVVINAQARLGANVIVNTGAIIEHDCEISDHVHVATGAKLAGTVFVGKGTHIGLGASVRQCVRIGANVLVGAGAVVVDDVPDNVIVVGVPARVRERTGAGW